MTQVFLVEGPVGAGKSTFSASLGRRYRAPRLTLDDWMATLFSPDRPEVGVIEWYLERKDRCIAQIWKVACEVLEVGAPVVLELGLVRRASRRCLYERVDGAGIDLTVYVIDAPKAVRRARVARRNQERGATFSMEVPDPMFELADSMWEPPDDEEILQRDVRFVSTAE